MPPINPSYLRVPALVLSFRQCTYFNNSDDTWIGIRKDKLYVAPTVIKTQENNKTDGTCTHPRDVLGTCKDCTFANEGETVMEFCAEWQFDNGFLIVYPRMVNNLIRLLLVLTRRFKTILTIHEMVVILLRYPKPIMILDT